MINRNVIKNWDKAHFITYLYMSMAYSDYNISEEELGAIKSKLKKLFTKKLNLNETNIDQVVTAVKKEISGHDIDDRQEILHKNKDHLKFTDDIKNDILSDLNDIISTDLVVDFNEHSMLSYARQLLINGDQ